VYYWEVLNKIKIIIFTKEKEKILYGKMSNMANNIAKEIHKNNNSNKEIKRHY
jgi:dsDNA-binding SOS-regulon protein